MIFSFIFICLLLHYSEYLFFSVECFQHNIFQLNLYWKKALFNHSVLSCKMNFEWGNLSSQWQVLLLSWGSCLNSKVKGENAIIMHCKVWKVRMHNELSLWIKQTLNARILRFILIYIYLPHLWKQEVVLHLMKHQYYTIEWILYS